MRTRLPQSLVHVVDAGVITLEMRRVRGFLS